MELNIPVDRQQFEKASYNFLARLFGLVENEFQIDVSDMILDHICWRSSSLQDYMNSLTALLSHGTLFHQSEHNGREISLISLTKPILFRSREISLIELPAPKQSKPFTNGFEHAEFVTNSTLKKLVNNYPKLNWDTKNIEKSINPDVKLQFDNLTLKFHPYTLAHVVKFMEK